MPPKFFRRLKRSWPAENISLGYLATHRLQDLKRRVVLNAFCDDVQTQSFAKLD